MEDSKNEEEVINILANADKKSEVSKIKSDKKSGFAQTGLKTMAIDVSGKAFWTKVVIHVFVLSRYV